MSLKLLSSQTASNSASVSFTSGIDSTYNEYVFYFVDINPATDTQKLTFQTSTDGGSSYGVTVLSTAFTPRHNEDGTSGEVIYDGGNSVANTTSFNPLTGTIGNGADECAAGELHLYSPSSTTRVKHWVSTFNLYEASNTAMGQYHSGFFNTVSAINAIQFKMGSGNFDGNIYMFGVS
jgi:hypothetical protein